MKTKTFTGLINHLRWIYIYRYTTQRESDLTYGQVWWLILRICALQLTHTQSAHTHTAVNTHTPWTHTRSSGQPFMLRHPGSSWGFGALLKCIKGGESTGHSLPPPTIPAGPDSNSQPLDYESDSLTIRPCLPFCKIPRLFYKHFWRKSISRSDKPCVVCDIKL